jgi:poly-gamma-glutamate synthesis protein (capsule biosynthesis protein)
MPSILATGDLMLGDSAASPGFGFASRYGKTGLGAALTPVQGLLGSGDVVVGNLEVVLSRTGVRDDQYATRDMRGWPRFASELAAAGFTVLNLANNHALQHGPEVFEETRALLEAAGIRCSGIRGAPPWTSEPVRISTPDGTSFGFLGYCLRPRQYHRDLVPPFAEGDRQGILSDVRRLATEGGVLVVSLHWGEDYVNLPDETEVELARAIVDAGASLVLGHHPHVLRPVERWGRGVIAYSLGNFLGDQTWHRSLTHAGVLECTVQADELTESRFHPTRLRRDYSVTLEGPSTPIGVGAPATLSPESYRRQAVVKAREFRRAKHLHAIRNLWRSDLRLMAQLASRTLANRIDALRGISR